MTEKSYPIQDFCQVGRTSAGHQVLAHLDQDEDGEPGLQLMALIDGALIGMLLTPLPANIIHGCISQEMTDAYADMIWEKLIEMRDENKLTT